MNKRSCCSVLSGGTPSGWSFEYPGQFGEYTARARASSSLKARFQSPLRKCRAFAAAFSNATSASRSAISFVPSSRTGPDPRLAWFDSPSWKFDLLRCTFRLDRRRFIVVQPGCGTRNQALVPVGQLPSFQVFALDGQSVCAVPICCAGSSRRCGNRRVP